MQVWGVHVDLEDQAGEEVTDLRAADHDRVTGPRVTAGHHQHVARGCPLVAVLARDAAGTAGVGVKLPLST